MSIVISISNQDQKLAATMVAAAAYEVFPLSKFIQAQAHPYGFTCDIAFPFEMKPEFIPLIEEKLRAILKNPEIKLMEMVPASAGPFFKQKGFIYDLPDEQLIEIVSINNFIAPCNSCTDKLDSNWCIKLYHHEINEEFVRFHGVLAENRKAIKEGVLKSKKTTESTHQAVGKRLNLFTIETNGCIWHPKGLKALNELQSTLKNQWENLGYKFVRTYGPVEIAHMDYLTEYPEKRIVEIREESDEEVSLFGLFDSLETTLQISSCMASKGEIQQECISLLHSVKKISIILNLCGAFTFSGSQKLFKWFETEDCTFEKETKKALLKYTVKDVFERDWIIFWVEISRIDEKKWMLTTSTTLQRLLALKLEHTR